MPRLTCRVTVSYEAEGRTTPGFTGPMVVLFTTATERRVVFVSLAPIRMGLTAISEHTGPVPPPVLTRAVFKIRLIGPEDIRKARPRLPWIR